MKCISLWQPWASALVCGSKRCETRSWRPPDFVIGKRIAIHASKRWGADEREWAEYLTTRRGIYLGMDPASPPLGAIVGVATLVGWMTTERAFPDEITRLIISAIHAGEPLPDDAPMTMYRGKAISTPNEYWLGNYYPNRFAWIFEDPVQFKAPIPYRGAQGFFEVPDDIVLAAEGESE